MSREVTRYGKTATIEIAHRRVLWPTPFGPRVCRLVLVREVGHDGFDIALITTDIEAPPTEIIERYATRWSIEVVFEEAKQIMGTGDARNRTEQAVRRTIPFGCLCQTILWFWYSTSLHGDSIVEERKIAQPWYRTKKTPSTSDMLATARRHLIAARFRAVRPEDLSHQEIQDLLVKVHALAS